MWTNLGEDIMLKNFFGAGIALLLVSVPSTVMAQIKQPYLPPTAVRIQVDTSRHQLTLWIHAKIRKTYPVALGTTLTPTPVGDWKVVNKHVDWGAGFGTRWLGLNVPWGIYGIHGTNQPRSIGRRASHGCIRMHNKDVEELYRLVPVGTSVEIMGHPLGTPTENPRPLAEGDIGSDVLLIQSRLRSAGLYSGAVNGKFNLGTEAAIRKFERTHKLPVDGVISIRDYYALGLLE
jgi:hypothetical protein